MVGLKAPGEGTTRFIMSPSSKTAVVRVVSNSIVKRTKEFWELTVYGLGVPMRVLNLTELHV